jgi:rod shape determining protein RodA
MIVIGFAVLFTVQVVENIGMMLGVLPITGIVLPFMSYGVSAMITYMGIIGIVININKRIF